ncbi:MAG: FKBP-type peptidyl-prolyl cis-trans isomerase [Flavobacteriales bacterium]
MKQLIALTLLLLAFACENAPKKNTTKKITKATTDHIGSLDTTAAGSKKNLINFEKGKVEKTKKLSSGIVLKWIEKGEGPSFQTGDMALIDYRLGTPDGRIIDGNNRIQLPFIPFVVGYSMQTQGWDLAFAHLRVGDFVKVEIPAALAYGAKGIKDILAPNTPNWLYVKIVSKIKPSIDANGIRAWKLADGQPFEQEAGSAKEVAYEFVASTPNRSNAIVARKFPQRYVSGQKTAVPGLRKILKNALQGERYYLVLQPEQAYGSKGFGQSIGPNESVFFLLDIVGVRSIS